MEGVAWRAGSELLLLSGDGDTAGAVSVAVLNTTLFEHGLCKMETMVHL